MTKSKKWLIILPIALLLITLIIIGVVYITRPVGLTTRKDIRVSAYHNNKTIILPVKMVKGLYTPNASYFNNKSDITALCDTIKDDYIIEIIGNNAIIKDKSSPKSANAQLLNVTGIHEKFNYGLVDGGVKIKDKTILMPLYLLNNFDYMQNFEAQNSVTATLHKDATWEMVKDFCDIDSYYQVTAINDTTIKVKGLMAQHSETFTVVYDTTTRQLSFTLDN